MIHSSTVEDGYYPPTVLSKNSNQKLLESFSYIYEFLLEHLTDLEKKRFTYIIAFLKKSTGINFSLYLLNTFFLDALEKKDLFSIKEAIKGWKLNYIEVINYRVVKAHSSFWDTIDKIICFENRYNCNHVIGLNENKLNLFSNNLKKARELVSNALPYMREEFVYLCPKVIVLESDNIQGGSSYEALGMFFINGKFDLTEIISNLIHETTHNYIYCLSTVDYLCKGEKKILSPIRKVRRSPEGVYHATIVLFRIITAFRIFLRNRKKYNILNSDYICDFIKNHEEDSLNSYKELKSNISMSMIASNFLENNRKKLEIEKKHHTV